MFTGIVAATGRVASIERYRKGRRIAVSPGSRYRRFREGESVCVSGVCLTAVRSGASLVSDISAETLRRSTLGALREGAEVNLEKALRWGDRISGHFVMGHVDGTCRLLSIKGEGNSCMYRFTVPRGFERMIVEKGSVALDGVSLTVATRRRRDFGVAVIPETRRRTTLGRATVGDRVNFEVDVFARYGAAGWRRRMRPPARGARRP